MNLHLNWALDDLKHKCDLSSHALLEILKIPKDIIILKYLQYFKASVGNRTLNNSSFYRISLEHTSFNHTIYQSPWKLKSKLCFAQKILMVFQNYLKSFYERIKIKRTESNVVSLKFHSF